MQRIKLMLLTIFFHWILTEKWKETCTKQEKSLQEETGEMHNNIWVCTVMYSTDVQNNRWSLSEYYYDIHINNHGKENIIHIVIKTSRRIKIEQLTIIIYSISNELTASTDKPKSAPQGAVPPPPGVPQGAVPPPPGVPQGAVPPPPGVPQGTVPPPPGAPQQAVPSPPRVPQGAMSPPPGVPQGAVSPPPGVTQGAVSPPPGVPQGAVVSPPGVPQGVAVAKGILSVFCIVMYTFPQINLSYI